VNLLGKKLILLGGVTLILATRPMGCFAGGKGPAAWWGFDEGKKDAVINNMSGTRDEIEGNFRYVRGVRWKAGR
jgi:hypothetical protein